MSHNFLNIDWNLFDKKTAENNRLMRKKNESTPYNKPLTYFLPPPVINSTLIYQDVNRDPLLRENITKFFLKKTIKWINNYSEFKNSTQLLPIMKTNIGYKMIYNILRHFIKKNNCNWYDLRNNYELVKDFIRYKLNKLSLTSKS
jgi:hypothetical protein